MDGCEGNTPSTTSESGTGVERVAAVLVVVGTRGGSLADRPVPNGDDDADAVTVSNGRLAGAGTLSSRYNSSSDDVDPEAEAASFSTTLPLLDSTSESCSSCPALRTTLSCGGSFSATVAKVLGFFFAKVSSMMLMVGDADADKQFNGSSWRRCVSFIAWFSKEKRASAE